MLAPSLQEIFIDDSTGEPLAGGIVTFYQDDNRTVKQPVYEISGTPPNYTYSPLPNPIFLSIYGVFVDGSGNDVLPYYYPFDTNGVQSLYYITVTDANGNVQFTREGFPNSGAGGGSGDETFYNNYVPNPQFLMHNNVQNLTTANVITQAITDVAQGGWTFERPMGSTATDLIEFHTFGYTASPTGNPRFAIEVINELVGIGDTYKDLRLKFDDVNKFASPTAQQYTFSFVAQSNGAGNVPVELFLVKNFGTGGSPSPTTITAIPGGTFSVTNTAFTVYKVAFTFGTNSATSIGTNNDDFIQIAIRFPLAATFDISITDVQLLFGNINTSLDVFPDTTDADYRARGIAGWMPTPDPNGFDLYLPLRLTAEGLEFDHTVVGNVIAQANALPIAGVGELPCNGLQYETLAYSSDGIPYARLQSVLYNSFINMPIYGTGAAYITSYTTSVTGMMLIAGNTAGSVASAADGTTATNFTFGISGNPVHDGAHPPSNIFQAHSFASTNANQLYVLNTNVGASLHTAVDVNTGFTVTQLRDNSAIRSLVGVSCVNTFSGGDYWEISSVNVDYYMWFTVDGSGVNPAPAGRTPITVNSSSSFSAGDIGTIVALAMNGYHIDAVTMRAGSTVAAGSYFNITTNTATYYIWYKVDGNGTDPKPANQIAIPVSILSTDTATQVETKTQIAINSKYFATPNLQGVFLRGYDPNSNWDSDVNNRWSYVDALSGPNMGTFELDGVMQHLHTIPPGLSGSGGDGFTSGSFGTNVDTGSFGGSETRPVNAYVNYVIKY